MSTTTADTEFDTTAHHTDTDTDYRTGDHTDYRMGPRPGARRLSRSADDRMLAGVAGGIARYLDVDVTLVRVGIAALTLLTGTAAAFYIAAWLLIPADGEDQSIAAAWLARREDRFR
jgi:phage shock protein PspC (stress-responsive transcriptional regulator)